MKITTSKHRSNAWAFRSLLNLPSGALLGVACFTTAFFAAISVHYARPQSGDDLTVYCFGAGSGRVVNGKASILWSPQLFLSITLGFGHFTFAEAKALDFAWDLIMGSGDQAAMIALVYPLFRRALLAHMESRPIPTATYTSVAFDGVSGTTIWVLLQELMPGKAINGRLRQRLSSGYTRPQEPSGRVSPAFRQPPASAKVDRVLWAGFIFAFVCLLTFAKMLSLMTGYQAIGRAIIESEDRTELLDATTVAVNFIIVHDGGRIGLADNYLSDTSDPNHDVLYQYMMASGKLPIYLRTDQFPPMTLPVTSKASSNEEGVFTWSFTSNSSVKDPTNRTALTYQSTITLLGASGYSNRTIPVPTFNMSLHSSIKGNGSLVAIDQSLMSYSYLVHNASCLPSAEYKWGFSFLLLFTFCMATLAYILVLQAMAWRVYEHSRSDRLQHPINVYQDAIDIAHELSEHYELPAKDIDCSTVKTKLQRDQASMILELDGLPGSRHVEREPDESGVAHRRFTFGISRTWYRRFAKFLNSHWQDEEVILYWPAKKQSGVARTTSIVTDKRNLEVEAASIAPRSDSGDAWADSKSVELRPVSLRTFDGLA